MKSATQPGHALSFTYDALGRKLTEVGPHGTVTSAWDKGGRRTKLTYPDGFVVDYTYLDTGEMKEIKQNTGPLIGSPTVLATFGYDNLGRRTSLSRLNGTSTTYSYDAVSRLSQLAHTMPAAPANNLTLGFSYNPASQITQNTRSNDAYAWTGHGNGTASSPANGLNQITSLAGGSIGYDAKGNMLNDPTIGYTYGYSSENLLTTASGGPWTGTLRYDPLMRLYESGVSGKSRFVYDGDTRIAEYYSSGAQTYRFIHGPGVDEPLIEYSGSGVGTRTFLHADERGSIIAGTDNSGAVSYIGRYDEYGKPGPTNYSRFGFTGQPYETLTELYYARARMYNHRGPRFTQVDPIRDGINWYSYASGDPINAFDPTGLATITWTGSTNAHVTFYVRMEKSGGDYAFSSSQLNNYTSRAVQGTVEFGGESVSVTSSVVVVAPGDLSTGGSDVKSMIAHSSESLTRHSDEAGHNPTQFRSHLDSLGASTIHLQNFEGVSTAAHELGHSAGAGGQRVGDLDAQGQAIASGRFSDTLMNNGAQNVNSQTLKEILNFKGNINIRR